MGSKQDRPILTHVTRSPTRETREMQTFEDSILGSMDGCEPGTFAFTFIFMLYSVSWNSIVAWCSTTTIIAVERGFAVGVTQRPLGRRDGTDRTRWLCDRYICFFCTMYHVSCRIVACIATTIFTIECGSVDEVTGRPFGRRTERRRCGQLIGLCSVSCFMFHVMNSVHNKVDGRRASSTKVAQTSCAVWYDVLHSFVCTYMYVSSQTPDLPRWT